MKNEPIYNLLNSINSPDDLRRLEVDQLPEVCDELRQDIIKELSCNPGHFAASLGTVELTMMHSHCPKFIWMTQDIRHTATKFSQDGVKHFPLTGNWEAFVLSLLLKRANTIPSPADTLLIPSLPPSAWLLPLPERETTNAM